MDRFKELLLKDNHSFQEEISKIDSADLIEYLENCNDEYIKIAYCEKSKVI